MEFLEKLRSVLYCLNSLCYEMIDKITTKDYVTEKYGGFIIPTLVIWYTFDEINR